MTISGEKKIKQREELVSIRESLKGQGRVVGYTSGVFDLLHPGHVDYLERAKGLCDVLIVGVNTDKSVRGNKGPSRPICCERERTEVLAGLACVDYIFLFEEKNNNQNVEILKPDIYFKAGDYSIAKLSSAPIIEAYGGRVEIIPMQAGLSSSAIIDKVLSSHISSVHATLENPNKVMLPAVFLDRDGTICEHIEYLHEPEKFKLLPGALEAMKKLYEAGYRIIIVTNQPGIGLGYFAKEDFYAVSKQMLKCCGKAGVLVDKIYFCPHSQSENCRCRKPSTGLIERAQEELNVDLKRSFVVGDMTSDIMLGKNAGIKTVLVQTGENGKDGRFSIEADKTAKDLGEAAEWILSSFKAPKA